jgi:hypothetical protein
MIGVRNPSRRRRGMAERPGYALSAQNPGGAALTDTEWAVLEQAAAEHVRITIVDEFPGRYRAAAHLCREGLLEKDAAGVYWATETGRWLLARRLPK